MGLPGQSTSSPVLAWEVVITWRQGGIIPTTHDLLPVLSPHPKKLTLSSQSYTHPQTLPLALQLCLAGHSGCESLWVLVHLCGCWAKGASSVHTRQWMWGSRDSMGVWGTVGLCSSVHGCGVGVWRVLRQMESRWVHVHSQE